MAEQLTPQQREAVENRGGKLLVSAAAGSGKTKVLVDRLLSYLTDPKDPANLDDFLIITYTKAAAAELRGKISEKLTQYIAQHPESRHMQQQIQRMHLAKICTVHSFCADILREYAYHLDITADFRIAEENECQEMMLQTLQQLLEQAYAENLDEESFRAFVDTQGLGRDDRQVSEIILQIYSSALCHLDPNGWLDWCVESANVEDLKDAADTPWGAYLVADFKEHLGLQIQSLERCMQQASPIPGLEKPVSLLAVTVTDLKSLQSCDTWDDIVKHPPIEYGTLTFKKEHKGTQLAEQIKAVRNACKDSVQKKLRTFADPSDTVLGHLKDSALAAEGLIRLVKEFRDRFEKMKRARRVLDFSDIEQLTLDLLLGRRRTGCTAAADEIGARFREIMVDEYQDSNAVQDAIFSALTNRRQNCFMVGDVKQSIYRFRLADPDIFLKKYNTFASTENAQPGQGRKVLLSSNFRSSGGVISAVNDVFAACMSPAVGGLHYAEAEMLREGIPHIPLTEPEVELYGIAVKEDTYQEESAFTARRICELLDGTHMIRQGDALRPVTPDDIVILLRSPGSVGGEFRYALEQAGIPCTMGTDVNLLQTPEVETLIAILQTVHNPLQDIPLLAALTSPVFGFTADDLAKIRSKHRYLSFFKALEKDASQKAEEFTAFLRTLRSAARFLTVSQLIQQIFAGTGMLSIYGAMESGDEKVRNLQSFCQIAADYESAGRKDLPCFLEYLTTMEEKGLNVQGSSPSGAVRIMSIHKSKGLEFPVVFLCGLSRIFNMSDTQKQVLCHKDLGLGLVHTNIRQRVCSPTIAKRAIAAKIRAESVSEELRVLYVAMTRARDRLIMTYAAANLEERLREIALRMDMSASGLLTANASCPGTWVLMTALQRTEAGAFFQFAERPDCVSVREHPWYIRVVQAEAIAEEALEAEMPADNTLPAEVLEQIRRGLSFRYPYSPATAVPSKLTVTQLKGREKDREAAEFTDMAQKKPLDFRIPAVRKDAHSGTEYGNAIHRVIQYLNLQHCDESHEIRRDIGQMEAAGLITQEQAQMVDIEKIVRFFQSDLGKRLKSGGEVLREFKFSILEKASEFYEVSSDDEILLQGVVDCALVEEAGITVLDFKTDFLTESNRQERIGQYRIQVKTYAKALERIYQKPVIAAYIYFFSTEELVRIE